MSTLVLLKVQTQARCYFASKCLLLVLNHYSDAYGIHYNDYIGVTQGSNSGLLLFCSVNACFSF